MSHIDDAKARLDAIGRHQDEVVEAATRGRHRGWDAAGAAAAWAAIASLDVRLSEALGLVAVVGAMAVALVCFTLAGRRGRAVVHRSRMTGRTWLVLGVAMVVAAGGAFGAVRLIERLDVPFGHTILGGVAVAVMALTSEAVNRAAFRRRRS
ncbi:hypothetical protein [Phytomonospora endophytica]|uniref:Uncharacterized protein n=1 Tax=Phytomonospora endophytica TaxID=714109 RepID=A0A841FUG1_9ACTN|nr:hypothetical protein [Phytomonospora endophytica]MBB6036159.1 hypothetical protein [Phytomonospora endophytica]GIG67062.1 hypothetical protein Pen01_33570 [Phytomonospora endophytica]